MDLLINAFHQAFNADSNVNLFIYGDGPERKHLEQLIQNHKLNDRVHLMGQQERSTIAQKMQECHCFVLASKSETFGVVFIEAMAMGLPVITTKSGGPNEFINPNNGILVETDSVSALAIALIEAEKNTSFMIKEPLQIQLEKNTIHYILSNYLVFFIKLIKTKSCSILFELLVKMD